MFPASLVEIHQWFKSMTQSVKQSSRKTSESWLYLLFFLIASSAGLAFTLTVPPLGAPDEAYHFQRTYSLSEGILLPHPETTLPKAVMDYPKGSVQLTETRQKNDFNQVNSPPLMYLPQLLGVLIARAFSSNINHIFIAGRLSNLAFWITSGLVSLKLFPFLKKTFMGILLLPMVVFLSASYSYDAISTSLAFLAIAYILHLAFTQDEPLQSSVHIFLALLFAVIGLAGKGNLLMPLLLFLIPPQRFGGRSKQIMTVLAYLALGFAVIMGWQLFVERNIGREFVLQNPFNLDPILQMKAVLRAPWVIPQVVVNSIKMNYVYYFQTMVAVFGQLDKYLPNWFYIIWSVAFLALVASDSLFPLELKVWQRILSLALGLSGIVLVFILLYILYSPLDGTWVMGIQGRYFIPFLPLIVLSLVPQAKPLPLARPVSTLALLCLVGLLYVSLFLYHAL